MMETVSLDALAAADGIVLPAAGAGGAGAGAGRAGRLAGVTEAGDEIWRYLDRWGRLTGERAADGEGWVVVCPWTDEHTGGAVSGAAYWLGGGYKCHHGHCQGRERRELSRWVDARVKDESGGLVCLSEWDFECVAGWRPAARNLPSVGPGDAGDAGTGTGTGDATTRFFADLVFVACEDKFYHLGSNTMLTRAAVDFTWSRELENVLPVVAPRTGETMRPATWFSHPDNRGRARMADLLTYWPGRGRYVLDDDGSGTRLANTWVAPERVGLSPGDADVADWLRLVRLVCGRDGPDAADLLLDWMALVVGEPGLKPGWHVLLQSEQGIGKDLLLQPVREGVGRTGWESINAKTLGSMFTGWAEKRFVQVNELKQTTGGSATGHDQYATLKEYTENTNQWVAVNRKYQKEYMARNTAAIFATSNEKGALAIEEDDRRFFVVSPGDTPPWTENEYGALRAWMFERGGAALAAEWLRERWEGLSAGRRDVLLRRAPRTPGRAALAAAVEDPARAWMREQIATGAWPDLMTGRDIGGALAAEARAGSSGFRFAPAPNKWGPWIRGMGGRQVYSNAPVRLLDGRNARLWATRGPDRFLNMGEPQLARAYKSAAACAFRDDNDDKDDKVTPILTPP